MNNYEIEAQKRWGDTDAYREHEQKTRNYTKEKWFDSNGKEFLQEIKSYLQNNC